MSERGDLHPIMLILALFSKCILGTGISAKKIHQNFRSLADLPDGAAKPNPVRPTKSTPHPANPHTTPLQAITLISPPPDDRQPTAILPCCLRHVVPRTLAALLLRWIFPGWRTWEPELPQDSRQVIPSYRPDLPATRNLPRSSHAASGTWFRQPLPRWLLCRISPVWRIRNPNSRRPPAPSPQPVAPVARTAPSSRPIFRRCLPPAAQFCQPLPIAISLATSPPRRTSPVLTYRQRTHHQLLLAK